MDYLYEDVISHLREAGSLYAVFITLSRLEFDSLDFRNGFGILFFP